MADLDAGPEPADLGARKLSESEWQARTAQRRTEEIAAGPPPCATCGQATTFAPLGVGLTCGGLWLRGWYMCPEQHGTHASGLCEVCEAPAARRRTTAMADLYVCPACNETEDCSCARFDTAITGARKARAEVYLRLGHLLAVLVERTIKCPTCSAAPTKNTCATCAAIDRMKRHVEEARRC